MGGQRAQLPESLLIRHDSTTFDGKGNPTTAELMPSTSNHAVKLGSVRKCRTGLHTPHRVQPKRQHSSTSSRIWADATHKQQPHSRACATSGLPRVTLTRVGAVAAGAATYPAAAAPKRSSGLHRARGTRRPHRPRTPPAAGAVGGLAVTARPSAPRRTRPCCRSRRPGLSCKCRLGSCCLSFKH